MPNDPAPPSADGSSGRACILFINQGGSGSDDDYDPRMDLVRGLRADYDVDERIGLNAEAVGLVRLAETGQPYAAIVTHLAPAAGARQKSLDLLTEIGRATVAPSIALTNAEGRDLIGIVDDVDLIVKPSTVERDLVALRAALAQCIGARECIRRVEPPHLVRRDGQVVVQATVRLRGGIGLSAGFMIVQACEKFAGDVRLRNLSDGEEDSPSAKNRMELVMCHAGFHWHPVEISVADVGPASEILARRLYEIVTARSCRELQQDRVPARKPTPTTRSTPRPSWRTVRLFISSTFRDMQAERDHLVRFVFPRLREELLKRRIHFVDVDLRWGVTTEQDASAVCREIVDECRPRFLCMLGGRYGWVPPGRDKSITADEVHYGVLDREPARIGFTYFYFRDPAATAAMVEEQPGEFCEPAGSPNERRLAELKRAIEDRGLPRFIYPAAWDQQQRRLIRLATFGERVHNDLLAGIDAEFGAGPAAKPDELAEEDAAMEAFVQERTQRFVLGGREAVLNELLLHLEGAGGNGCLCLIGEPGSGKSALLAHLRLHAGFDSQPPILLLHHFVGASAGSTDERRTLRRLCHGLSVGAGLAAEVPDDPEKLRQGFPGILKQACAKMRVVVLLDAVDQFDAGSPALAWLPDELPDRARIVMTTLAGPALDQLRRRRVPPKEVVLPSLTPNDADAIISEFLHRYRKSMTPEQRAALRAKTDAATPLYLLAALEELRTLGTYEEITRRIRELPDTTQALFGWILRRLEDDSGFRDADDRLVGRDLVSRCAALLAASRSGLSQRELAELLTPGNLDARSPAEPGLPGNVAALLRLLRPYLMHRGELLDFYHRQFRAAVEQTYLRTEASRAAAHTTLADYFRHQADPGHDGRWGGDGVRAFVELPFHLARGDAGRLRELLWDPGWYRAKLKHTGVHGLLPDLALVTQDQGLRLVRDAVSLSAHVLTRGAAQLASQLVGRLLSCDEPRINKLLNDIVRTQDGSWLRPLMPSLAPPGGPLLRTLEGHTRCVSSVAVTADGKAVSGSHDHTIKVWDIATGQLLRTIEDPTSWIQAVALTANGRTIAGSFDKTIGVWDLASGKLLRTLEGHTDTVDCVAVAVDGKVVSGSRDHTLKVWELACGGLLRTLPGHTGTVNAVAVTVDGWVVSGSNDRTLKVWDLVSGGLLRTLKGHAGAVNSVAVTVDGRAVSGSHDHALKVWDLASGKLLRTLKGHTGTVNSVAVTADRRVISGSEDQTLRIWDLSSGRLLHTLEGYGSEVTSVAVTADGKAVSGSGHYVSESHATTLKVWDLAPGRLLPTVESHTDCVSSVAMARNGRVVSASTDHTLKVWDLASGQVLHTLASHGGPVNAVVATADGKAVSGSNDRTLKVWNLASGKLLRTLKGHGGEVVPLALIAGGKVISGSCDKTLKVWDPASGRLLHTLEGHGNWIRSVAVTPGGQAVSGAGHIFASKGDYALNVWDLASGRLLRKLEGHSSEVTCVALTADGKVVSGSDDDTLNVWNLATGELLHTLEDHTDGVWSVAVTAGGRIVSGSDDHTIKVWDLASGECLRTLEGHTDRVWGLTVTADDKAISWSHDQTLNVWDLASGQLLASFHGDYPPHACAVAQDGRTVVVGGLGGDVHFLRLVLAGDQAANAATAGPPHPAMRLSLQSDPVVTVWRRRPPLTHPWWKLW